MCTQDFSFLLNSLQPGDRVLLYGMGQCGKRIYTFLRKNCKCHIEGFVDAKAERLSHEEVQVYPLESLLKKPPLVYDKLILTLWDQKIGFAVFHQLIDKYGVDRAKIIPVFAFVGPFCEISLADFAGSRMTVMNEIDKFIANNYRQMEYFRPIITELKSQKDSEYIVRLKSFVPELPPKECIVLAYIFFHAALLDAKILESMLQAALQIDDPSLVDFLYGVFLDTGYMPLQYEECYFPAYYLLRRELLKKVCLAYDLQCPPVKKETNASGKIKHIWILCDMLRDETKEV